MTQVVHFENLALLYPFITIGHQARTQILLSWVETTLYSKFYYKKNGCVPVWCHSELLPLSLIRRKDLGHFWLDYIRMLGHLQMSAHLMNFDRP